LSANTPVMIVSHIPILRDLFASNEKEIVQTDIVMLLTPHVVRAHSLTMKDFAPLFVGTQGNLGLAGPPPLIQAPGQGAAPAAPPARPTPTPAAPPVAPGLRRRMRRPSPRSSLRRRRVRRLRPGRSPPPRPPRRRRR
jgi:hypothetical protein